MAKKTKNIKDRKGPSFEAEVVQILSLMQYQVSHDILLSGTQIDILAEQSDFLQKMRLIVECADHNKKVGIQLVKEKSATLGVVPKDNFIYKLLYVSRMGFTKEAVEFASNSSQIDLLSIAELEATLINFEPYARWYLQSYEQSTGMFAEGELSKNFIELNASSDGSSFSGEPISKIARNWLSDETNNLLILLGEFGSGKTSFCRNFAYLLLDEKFRRLQNQPFVPILLNLRDNKRMFDLPKVLFDTLVNRYGIKLPSLMALEHFCSKRKILLILDGLDEMIDKSDHEAIADCFNQVFLLSSLNAKVVITCRTNFFRENADLIRALKRFSVEIKDANSGENEVLSFQKHGSIINVSKLSPQKIRKYVSNQVDDADEALRKIANIHDLSDLCTRPVLLNMILETLPKLEKKGSDINSGYLYEEYTDRWTARDEWRVELPLVVRQKFCVLLAWAMHSSNIEEIGVSELRDLVGVVLEDLPNLSENMARYENDIQTCSFLVRLGNEGVFRFAHNSFLEYFAALHFVESILEKEEIEKLSLDEIIASSKEDESETATIDSKLIVSNLEWISLGVGKSIWLSSIQSHIDFEPSHRPYLRNRHKGYWEHTVAIRGRFGNVFSLRKPGNESHKKGLTEEIATFAIEIMGNRKLNPDDLLRDLSKESTSVFADILRLSKPNLFVTNNIEYFKANGLDHPSSVLRTAFCAALAVSHDDLDIAYVIKAREKLDPDAWSYFILELAVRGKTYSKLFVDIYKLDELGPLDKAICIHGRRETLTRDSDEMMLFDEAVVVNLLSSKKTSETKVGLEMASYMPGSLVIVRALCSAYRGCARELRLEILKTLGRYDSDGSWKIVRGLLVVENDPILIKKISKTEERMRGKDDKRGARKNKKNREYFKNALWQRSNKPFTK